MRERERKNNNIKLERERKNASKHIKLKKIKYVRLSLLQHKSIEQTYKLR